MRPPSPALEASHQKTIDHLGDEFFVKRGDQLVKYLPEGLTRVGFSVTFGFRWRVFFGISTAPYPAPFSDRFKRIAMADFRTHMTVSTIAGSLFGLGGYQSGFPIESCIISGALCSVCGMLPDLDSDSGIPLREAVSFASAFVPMLMVDRLRRMGMSHEMMLVTTIVIYFVLRFGIAEFFRRYTVHRGMWHSIPAALTAALFSFLVCASENMSLRLFKTLAVFIGFMSHILLDEIWSVDFRRGRYTFKHSFGSALKFFGQSRIANVFSYLLLISLCMLAYYDEGLMQRYGYQAKSPQTAMEWFNRFRLHTQDILTR